MIRKNPTKNKNIKKWVGGDVRGFRLFICIAPDKEPVENILTTATIQKKRLSELGQHWISL